MQTRARRMREALQRIRRPAPSPKVPTWATTAATTSDGYVVQLATLHGMKLATLDAGIQDRMADVIP